MKFETTNYQIIYGKDKVRNDMEDEFYIDLPMPIISLNVFQLFFSCRNSEYETAKRGLTLKVKAECRQHVNNVGYL